MIASYELCSVAPSLFDDHGFMRSGGKSKLADYLVPALAKTKSRINDSLLRKNETKIVLDGGALIQRVSWAKGSTFAQIIKSYEVHIRKMCGSVLGRVQVVFDGYAKFNQRPYPPKTIPYPVYGSAVYSRSNIAEQEIRVLVQPSQ